MKNRLPFITGALIIIGFGYLGATEMTAARMPYITCVSEVRASNGRPVQFIGNIVPNDVVYSGSTGELLFSLTDDKSDKLMVRYKGVKAANLDSASKALVRGKYEGGELIADQILLKCPSRYQGN
jgi:cytochrome c-type biogenesis protein CcmE